MYREKSQREPKDILTQEKPQRETLIIFLSLIQGKFIWSPTQRSDFQ
jgi:hypothetical protein